jgi:hypothetical protein
MSPNNEVLRYKIAFDPRSDMLCVRVEGIKDSYEISIAYWREIAAQCARLGVSRLLMDEDIPEAVSFSDMYRIASELPEIFRDIAIAFVDKHAEQSELNEFGELVAQNRGVYGRFFTDTAAAEEWLRKQN